MTLAINSTDFKLIKSIIEPSCKVRKLTFAITYKCNYRCRHCHIWKIYRLNPKLMNQELEAQDIIKVFNHTKSLLWVSITGGEPFLRNDLIEIVRHILTKRVRIISINTNGSLPYRIYEVINELCKEVRNDRPRIIVPISIDGTKEVHDSIRGVDGAFEKAITTYTLLNYLSAKYKCIVPLFEITITPYNFNNIANLINYLLNNSGFPKLNIVFTLMHISTYYFHGNIDIPKVVTLDYGKVIKNTKLHNAFTDMLGMMNKAFLGLYDMMSYRHSKYCVAGCKSVFMDPFGNVKPCSMIDYVIGKVREENCDYDLNKFINTPRGREFIMRKRLIGCNCWTPCEAYQTIISKPYLLLYGIFKYLLI